MLLIWLDRNYLVSGSVSTKTHLFHLLCVSCLSNSNKTWNIQFRSLFLELSHHCVRDFGMMKMLYFFLDRKSSISRKAKSFNKLIRLSFFHGLNTSLLLNPRLHNNQLPRFLDAQPPKRQLLHPNSRYKIIDIIDIIFTIPPNKILVISSLIHHLRYKPSLDVFTIDHAEFREKSWQLGCSILIKL